MKKRGFTLAEGEKIALECNKKAEKQTGRQKAFTLAEVLISLAIIGVIAAITVPTLIQRTNKQEYVTALQKAYSTLSQVTNQIIAENGSPFGNEGWANTVENVYLMYMQHLNNAKECGSGKGCMSQKVSDKSSASFKYLNGNSAGWNAESGNYRTLILADGMQVVFANIRLKSDNGEIWVDVNGEKKPNVIGRDIFTFDIKNNGLYPNGCDLSDCTKGATPGWGCACKVLKEGAMNY